MVVIYTHPSSLNHDTGLGHPECPDRLHRVLERLAQEGYQTIPAPEADMEWIARAHPVRYIDRVMESIPDRGTAHLDGDTVVSPGSWVAALHAVGAVCAAVADCVDGTATRAFCAVRPPGHHAEPERAMGFCLFNNVFVGALHARALGLERVAIVDFDVHHGNGSDAMVRRHDGIFFASSHQWPLYPGTGAPDDQIAGRLLNVPLPAGTDGVGFRAAYRDVILPAVAGFAPDLLMISAGFDAHRDDPLAQMALAEDDFEWVTRELCRLAPRVVSVLEGGYNLDALPTCVAAHLRGMG